MPDFAETLVCGSDTCSNGHEDSDGNGIADWIDFVICGTAGCATGQEDFDGNGVADAAELAACVKQDPGYLAYTGFQAGSVILVALVLLGGGLILVYRRRQAGTAAATALTVTPVGDGGAFALEELLSDASSSSTDGSGNDVKDQA